MSVSATTKVERPMALLARWVAVCGVVTAQTLAPGLARAATYVVDQTIPGADDTNPGTEAQPFNGSSTRF